MTGARPSDTQDPGAPSALTPASRQRGRHELLVGLSRPEVASSGGGSVPEGPGVRSDS
jgi:hypothetical protein